MPLRSGAVTRALEHAEVSTPRADALAILVRHHAGDLVQVREIVNGPGRQQLRQGDGAQRRMPPAPAEISRRD